MRSARPEDLEAIWRLEEEIFEPHRRATRASLRHSLESPLQRVWVAELRGEVIGFLIAWFRSRMWRVYDVAVHPSARGQGVGRALMAMAERGARTARAERIVLEADAARAPFYEDLGYEVSHELPDFYGPGRHAVRLEKRIGPGV